MEELINRLVKEITPTVCNGIEEKYWQEIKTTYQKLLYNRYANIDTILNTTDYEKLYNSLYESEMEEWAKLSAFTKKSLLIKDDALEKIISLSNESFKYARERLEKNIYISKELASTYMEKLKTLLKQVNIENKEMATTSLQQGMIDLLYASNQSDSISSRLAHYM